MTANDYANIQRMIEESIALEVPDDYATEQDIQDAVSPVANDVSRLEQTVSDLEASL